MTDVAAHSELENVQAQAHNRSAMTCVPSVGVCESAIYVRCTISGQRQYSEEQRMPNESVCSLSREAHVEGCVRCVFVWHIERDFVAGEE